MNKINRFANSPKGTHPTALKRGAGTRREHPTLLPATQSHPQETRRACSDACANRSTKTAQKWSRTAASNIPCAPVYLNYALHAKSAEFWLRLGEPLEALAELENVPYALRRNGWLHRLHVAARSAARAFHADSIQESP
jgi:hypothetical protein